MAVFWLSWYDDPYGPPGLSEPEVNVWDTGFRVADGFTTRCAHVVADDARSAWRKLDVMYPGASTSERRFEEEKPDGWWPPEDRFPRSRK